MLKKFMWGDIVRYILGNPVLQLHSHLAVKLKFQPYICQYISPNENFEYSYVYPNYEPMELHVVF